MKEQRSFEKNVFNKTHKADSRCLSFFVYSRDLTAQLTLKNDHMVVLAKIDSRDNDPSSCPDFLHETMAASSSFKIGCFLWEHSFCGHIGLAHASCVISQGCSQPSAVAHKPFK